MKTYSQVVEELDAKIPRHVIAKRDGGNVRKLDYLEGWYVIDRLNKVLGPGNWAYASEVTQTFCGEVQGKYGTEYYTSYIARVRLLVTLPGLSTPTEFSDYGFGDGRDKALLGKTHELAVKEAVTDGLKRCAKNLGMSFGLALYDKSQKNVDDSERSGSAGPALSSPAPVSRNIQAQPIGGSALDAKGVGHQALLADISLRAGELLRVKTVPPAEVILHMKNTYKVSKKEELSVEQAKEFLAYLNSRIAQATVKPSMKG